MNLYKKLRDISAVTFHDIKFSGNVYLIDKDHEEDKKYGAADIVEISEAWSDLYDEYYEKTDDPRLRRELKNKKKNLKLLIDINLLEVFIETLKLMQENQDYVPEEAKLSTFSSFKNSLARISKMIVFDTLADLKTNIKNVTGYTAGLRTRYELQFRDDMKVDINDLLLYYEIKANIEQILKKDHIPDYINMLQWIAYEKQAKRELKHGRKHHKGPGGHPSIN